MCAAFAGTTANMKSLGALFSLLAAVPARAHISQVCTVTHPDNLGVVTFFLGTYHHGNSMTQNVAGEVYITPPSGLTRQYGFTQVCTIGNVPYTMTMDQAKQNFQTYTDTYYFGGATNTACKNLNDKNGNPSSRQTVRLHATRSTRTRPTGTTGPFRCTAATRTSIESTASARATSRRASGGSHQCTTRSRERLSSRSWALTSKCSPVVFRHAAWSRRAGGSACRKKGQPVYTAVGVAKQGQRCTTDVPDSVLTYAATTSPTTCDGSRFNDILSGFNCPIECLPGYRPVGNLICDNGRWATENFKCTDSPICGVPTSQTMASDLDANIAGLVTTDKCSSITEAGTECFYTCNNNMIGTGTIRCTTNSRVWQRGSDYDGCKATCSSNPNNGTMPVGCNTAADFALCCGD